MGGSEWRNENIVSGSYDDTIKVWNSDTYLLKLIHDCSTNKYHTFILNSNLENSDAVYALAIIPSNENIVSGSEDGTIKVWKLSSYLNIDDEILDLQGQNDLHDCLMAKNLFLFFWLPSIFFEYSIKVLLRILIKK